MPTFKWHYLFVNIGYIHISEWAVERLLGSDVASLLHEAAPVVPEAVVESQLVLQLLRLLHARVRVLPFKRSQPAIGCCIWQERILVWTLRGGTWWWRRPDRQLSYRSTRPRREAKHTNINWNMMMNCIEDGWWCLWPEGKRRDCLEQVCPSWTEFPLLSHNSHHHHGYPANSHHDKNHHHHHYHHDHHYHDDDLYSCMALWNPPQSAWLTGENKRFV